MRFLSGLFLALSLLFVSAPAQAQGDSDWFYRGSDIPRDPEWRFGTLPNGVRYAVRRNALPERQVSIRVRIAAGSLHEEDAERGWAHLVEHLAFRGSRSFADQEGRHLWQKLGASFGSDSNATTTANHTVYQLDLPNASEASLDTSLHVLSEMVDTALFDPAAVDAERKIVLQEKGRRPELSTKLLETSWPLFYGGLRYANRDPIGTEATLRAATPQALRSFYERWYRPDRTTVIMAGDADPAVMERLIAKRFGDWKPETPAPGEPDYGSIAARSDRVETLAYPGAPYSASLMWLRPFQARPHTLAREKTDLAEALATRILNRRLEAKARVQADYVGAGVGSGRPLHVADLTQLSVTAREGKWKEGLEQSFAIIADALRAPPSEAEVSRELQNLRTAATSALEGERTMRSQQRVAQMVNAVNEGDVVTNAASTLKLLDQMAPELTPAVVWEATRALFRGGPPRLLLLSPQPVPGGEAAVASALAAAEKAAPATRQADRKVSMDLLPPLGSPGREVSRQEIKDLGVTIVRFANGSSLTFKQTQFEKGSVQVQLRFGSGFVGLPADRRSPAFMSGIIGSSGVADLDLDGLERLLTGRRMSIGFGMAEDAFTLRGVTTGQDIKDQLRLLATKLAYPRWDAPLLARAKAGALESYDLSFSSAGARAGREVGGFTRSGDPRWLPTEKAEIAAVTLDDVRSFFEPRLAQGPIEAIVVGDVDLETVVNAMKATVAALPARAPAPVTEAQRRARPPSPDPKPRLFTHNGDKDQAYALIGWSTFGGKGRLADRRALSLAANMFQVRLFERLREVEGASYSPSASASTSEEQPGWGVFYAASEIRPESADTFFRIAREIVADMAAKPAAPAEFERAQNPVISGIQRRLMTNGYWLGAMSDWVNEPALIDETRSYLADYSKMTAEDVRRAVATHVADAGDWSMLVLPGKAPKSGN